MAKVAFLLPRDDMLPYIPALAQKHHLEVVAARVIQTSEAVASAHQAVEDGADILIARGFQAERIRASTSTPVVYIQFSAQEVGAMIRKATALASKAGPVVGLVGFPNMFHDISQLGSLLGVSLRTYFVDYRDRDGVLEQGAAQALAEGADVLIGGDIVCGYAAAHGIPSVFIDSSLECMENACRDARRTAYAMDMEKRSNAERQIILDYTVSGLILVDGEGTIRQLNHSAERLLEGVQQQGAAGSPIWEYFPALTADVLAPALQQGEELTALHLKRGKARFLATISPISPEGGDAGVVISIADDRQLKQYAAQQRMELFRQGFSAPFTFDSFVARSPRMLALLEQAARCARFDASLIIQGEFGTEKEELAQCIHNAGSNPENAFVHFDCQSMEPQLAEERLFGANGLLEQAQGIIFLDQISCLSPSAQHRLYRLVSRKIHLPEGAVNRELPPLRVLAADTQDLAALAAAGKFDRELYYAISISVFCIPPLRERREDIVPIADFFLHSFQEHYGRYIHLTKTAWRSIQSYSWPGNLVELRSFCQKLVVSSPRRTVDEFFVDNLLQPSEPIPHVPKTATVIYRDSSSQLIELLEVYHGNRKAVAKALGISTTTLWRRMRKYGIIQ